MGAVGPLSVWNADRSEPVEEITIGAVLRRAAEQSPDLLGLIAGMAEPADRRRWTFAELYEDARRVAAGLLDRFEPGDRVALWAPNVPPWVVLEYGAALAGVTLVTVNPAFKADELRYVLGQSRSAGIFLTPSYRGNPMWEYLESVRAELPELHEVVSLDDWEDFLDSGTPSDLPDVDPAAPAQIQYTSGTTGFPKGALLSHRGIINNARFIATRVGLERGETLLTPMPLFHTGGCVVAGLGALQAQAALCPLLAFEPGLMLELLEETRATVTGGVPLMAHAMMAHPDFGTRDLSTLRTIILGGSAVAPQLVRDVEKSFGAAVAIIFGQTEASPAITLAHREDSPEDKAESLGRPLPQVEVAILGPEGDPVPVGDVGEICCRGYQTMLGYFDMPDATAAAIDDDGWLHTGDLGSMDERGYLYIRGRLKEMLIRGGENIFPAEIENVLAEHAAVESAAVIGVPDERWGETIAAFVVLRDGAVTSAEDLRQFVRSRLAPFKAPATVHFVDEFPVTGSGKVQKFLLRDRLVDREHPSTIEAADHRT